MYIWKQVALDKYYWTLNTIGLDPETSLNFELNLWTSLNWALTHLTFWNYESLAHSHLWTLAPGRQAQICVNRAFHFLSLQMCFNQPCSWGRGSVGACDTEWVSTRNNLTGGTTSNVIWLTIDRKAQKKSFKKVCWLWCHGVDLSKKKRNKLLFGWKQPTLVLKELARPSTELPPPWCHS